MIVVLYYVFLFVFWLENVIGFSLTHTKGLSLLNLVLYVMFLLWSVSIFWKKRIFESNSVNKYIFILIFIVCLSIPIKFMLKEIPNLNFYNELVNLKGWLNPILLFFILYNTISDEKTCYRLTNAMVVFLIVTVITTLGTAAGGIHLGKVKVVQGGRSAGFAEPNQYAAYLILFLPLLFSYILFPESKIKGLLYFGITSLALASLLVTGSRGGLLAFLFLICVYFAILLRKRLIRVKKLLIILLVLLPVLFSGAFFLMPSQTKITIESRVNVKKFRSADDFTSGRLTLWVNGIRIFLKQPLWGHGISSYMPLVRKECRVIGNSHNDYILYLVQYGIVGLIAFLFVLWAILREALHYLHSSDDIKVKLYILSYIAGFSGYAFAMFGVNIFQPRYFFWAYTAVILKLGKLAVHWTSLSEKRCELN